MKLTKNAPEIKTVDTKIVYENKWMRVREDNIERASGAQGIYSVVEKPHFAIIIPLENNYVYMVEQYRYPVGSRQREFVQGTWDENPDVDPKELAARELKEETGLTANSWTYVGFQYLANGMSNQGYHIYVAQQLVQGEQHLDDEEEGLTVHRVSIKQLVNDIKDGKLTDASTCNAFGLARLKGLL